MARRQIPEEVSCPICEHGEWRVLNEDGESIRFVGLDVKDWYPLDTDVFMCGKCGFLRFHAAPAKEGH